MSEVITRNLDPRIREMVMRIVEQFHPDRIYLFGSHARGNPAPDSDVDLLVVMPTEEIREKAMEIDLALVDRTVPLDLLVVTPEILERDRDCFGSILRTIVREGKVVYDRAA